MLINDILQLILYASFFGGIIYSIIYAVNKAYNTVNTIFYKKNNVEKIKEFASYLTFLHYHMDRAYDIIHKDHILIYSIEGVKLEEEKLIIATKQFIKITLDFMGPTMIQELVDVYGDEDTLLLNITEYFSTKYEDDSIRDDGIKDIMGSNDDIIDDDTRRLLRN